MIQAPSTEEGKQGLGMGIVRQSSQCRIMMMPPPKGLGPRTFFSQRDPLRGHLAARPKPTIRMQGLWSWSGHAGPDAGAAF